MKLTIITKEDHEDRREIRQYIESIKDDLHEGVDFNVYDSKTKEAQSVMQLYGLMQYPAIVITRPLDGSVIQTWQGMPLPRKSEIVYFANS
ncbi:TPA: hypothetical protein EYO12_00130 [Candidatus Saccharibacteria bacterium]|nr:hypothetical protein [Candidatus Saccharibacteria bacterium]HIO87204.1 hypothetical protein [Candidatus Saccharibacteria bacterium]